MLKAYGMSKSSSVPSKTNPCPKTAETDAGLPAKVPKAPPETASKFKTPLSSKRSQCLRLGSMSGRSAGHVMQPSARRLISGQRHGLTSVPLAWPASSAISCAVNTRS